MGSQSRLHSSCCYLGPFAEVWRAQVEIHPSISPSLWESCGKAAPQRKGLDLSPANLPQRYSYIALRLPGPLRPTRQRSFL